MAQKKKEENKSSIAKVTFHDKDAKQFLAADFMDTVPDAKWIGRKMNKASGAAVLIVLQKQPKTKHKPIIIKNTVGKVRGLSDATKAKFKKLGADI